MSAHKCVLRDLQRGQKISQLTALRNYGTMRLAVIIHRLRQQGHKIITDERHQRGKTFAVYRLEKPQDEA